MVRSSSLICMLEEVLFGYSIYICLQCWGCASMQSSYKVQPEIYTCREKKKNMQSYSVHSHHHLKRFLLSPSKDLKCFESIYIHSVPRLQIHTSKKMPQTQSTMEAKHRFFINSFFKENSCKRRRPCILLAHFDFLSTKR